MIEKFNDYLQFGISLAIGLVGGIIAFYYKLRSDKTLMHQQTIDLETRKIKSLWETQEILLKYQNQLTDLQKETVHLIDEVRKLKIQLSEAEDHINTLTKNLNRANQEIDVLNSKLIMSDKEINFLKNDK